MSDPARPRRGAPRLGIDLGGTKIEALLLGADGTPLWRERVPTPQGDYAATLGACNEVFVNFSRPDTERKIYAWLQGALANKKVVTVQAGNSEAYGILRGEENRGVKPWSNLLQPGNVTNPPVKRATKPLMRPTRKIEKPVS